jgi:hypothetical protein
LRNIFMAGLPCRSRGSPSASNRVVYGERTRPWPSGYGVPRVAGRGREIQALTLNTSQAGKFRNILCPHESYSGVSFRGPTLPGPRSAIGDKGIPRLRLFQGTLFVARQLCRRSSFHKEVACVRRLPVQ